MFRIVAHECLYLTTAMMLSYWATLLVGNPSKSTLAMLVAFVIPVGICLIRLSYLKWPQPGTGWLRRQCYQLIMAFALISLLICDVAVGILANLPGIPLGVWIVISFLGLLYLFLFCLALRIGFGPFNPDHETQDTGRYTAHP